MATDVDVNSLHNRLQFNPSFSSPFSDSSALSVAASWTDDFCMGCCLLAPITSGAHFSLHVVQDHVGHAKIYQARETAVPHCNGIWKGAHGLLKVAS
jgi:hypothetical protein